MNLINHSWVSTMCKVPGDARKQQWCMWGLVRSEERSSLLIPPTSPSGKWSEHSSNFHLEEPLGRRALLLQQTRNLAYLPVFADHCPRQGEKHPSFHPLSFLLQIPPHTQKAMGTTVREKWRKTKLETDSPLWCWQAEVLKRFASE